MKLHDINGRTAFGWTLKTHAALTGRAIAKIPQLEEFRFILQKASIAPDFSLKYTGFFNDRHKYFGHTPFVYGKNPQNAFDMYDFFLNKAIKNLAAENDVVGMQEAGMALHFLQDVASPFHTDKNATGLFNILPHRRYEVLADDFPKVIEDAAQKNIKSGQNFFDIFRYTYLDKRPEEIAVAAAGKNSKTNMEISIKHTLASAYEATEKFLRRLALVDGLPDGKKEKFLLLDADEFIRGNFR